MGKMKLLYSFDKNLTETNKKCIIKAFFKVYSENSFSSYVDIES